MSQVRRFVTAGGTLACALGVGYIMQSSETAAKRYGAPETPAPTLEVLEVGQLVEVGAIELTAANGVSDTAAADDTQVDATSVDMAALDDAAPVLEDAPAIEAPACEISATASPAAAAMVDLIVYAPCMANERMTVHHEGMVFTHVTDTAGTISLTVPALVEDAMFILAFSNGDGAVVKTQVSSVAFYDRVVLQWKGDSGFQIHAREFGANYGEDGHVWANAARDASIAASGSGGFLSTVGDANAPEPMLAEVYSFPTGTSVNSGDVILSIETEVTEANCGQEVDAQTIESHQGADTVARDITLVVPGCDTVGDFLVLNNLVQDLKVASN